MQHEQPWVSGHFAAMAQIKTERGSAKMTKKGGGKGKSDGPWPQSVQIDALQGLWKEVGHLKKHWLIRGYMATEVTSVGKMGRRFMVQEGADGNVEWGSGRYFLDRRFGFGTETAIWRRRTPDGPEAFSWKFVKTLPLGAQAGSRAGHAPAEEHPVGEWHTNPADGGAYTCPEMRARYVDGYTRRESEARSEACKMVKLPEDVHVERRTDPHSGTIYTLKELAARYCYEFSVHEIREFWNHCQLVSWAMPARRIDPADGMPYSWKEMSEFYANDYSLSATVAYWDACKEEDASDKSTAAVAAAAVTAVLQDAADGSASAVVSSGSSAYT